MSETNAGDPAGTGRDDASTNDPAGTQTNSGPDAGGSEQQGANGGKYRERLAAAESERDQLKATVDSLRKQMVETMIDDLKPDAFWAWAANAEGGVDALLTEDGNVDPEKVAAGVDAARKKFGIRPGPRAPFDPYSGTSDLAGVEQGDEFARAFEFNPQGDTP
ncbi:hypothetical protein ACLTEW_18440 [Gordonia lacunae]|uniref:hypothetical protein n=1 Tax=Gordonia lacunae TaxID=417102 RepID=UPI0039E33D70